MKNLKALEADVLNSLMSEFHRFILIISSLPIRISNKTREISFITVENMNHGIIGGIDIQKIFGFGFQFKKKEAIKESFTSKNDYTCEMEVKLK